MKEVKKKTLFDHINTITGKNDGQYYNNLSVEDRKTFNVYMIHRFLSMNPGWIDVVNAIQKFSQQLKQAGTFRIYNEIIPKGRIFLKYVKSKKDKTYNETVLNILMKYFELGKQQVKQYYDIYLSTVEGRDALIGIVRMYGGDEKEMKKLTRELKVRMLGE